MLSKLSASALLLVGIIHLLPVPGVLGGDMLARLYGIPVDSPDLGLLLRHRAVLFGLLGAALVVAAFVPSWRWMAYAAGFVSVASFLLLAVLEGPRQPEVARVVTADIIAMVALVVGAVAEWQARQPG